LAQFIVVGALQGRAVEPHLERYLRLTSGSTNVVLVAYAHEIRGIVSWVVDYLDEAHIELVDGARLSGQYAPSRYPATAGVALWSRDADAAERDLEAFDAIGAHGPAIELRRLAIRAGIAAIRHRRSEALPICRDPLARGRDLKLPWEEAFIGLEIGPSGRRPSASASTHTTRLATIMATPTYSRRITRSSARPSGPDSSTRGSRWPSRHVTATRGMWGSGGSC
jgi:hypothetical protein